MTVIPLPATQRLGQDATEGLRCQILVTKGSDCSNGGISSTCRDVILLDSRLPEMTKVMKAAGHMPVRLWAPNTSAPAVQLRETLPGYLVANPVDQPVNAVGPMASGAWIVSSDPRFVGLTGSHRPIPLHDRFESQALYDALSH